MAGPIAAAPSPLPARLRAYLQLTRLDKPIGVWLLLWPTLWALWFAARGVPPLPLLLVFVAGTVLMRSAGCVINDFADRDFDGHVERTRQRPLASGRVSPREAIVLFLVLCALSLLCALPLNARALWLSVPAVLLAASYPFAKRYHQLPQAHLGIAFSWGIPMAFAAISPHPDWGLAALLMAANLCWVIAYDTFYAMVDREDDLKIGVRSTAILFGGRDLSIIALLQLGALVLLGVAGLMADLHLPYFLGLAFAALSAARQQYLARDRDRDGCFAAFLANHRFGAAVFLGLAGALLLERWL